MCLHPTLAIHLYPTNLLHAILHYIHDFFCDLPLLLLPGSSILIIPCLVNPTSSNLWSTRTDNTQYYPFDFCLFDLNSQFWYSLQFHNTVCILFLEDYSYSISPPIYTMVEHFKSTSNTPGITSLPSGLKIYLPSFSLSHQLALSFYQSYSVHLKSVLSPSHSCINLLFPLEPCWTKAPEVVFVNPEPDWLGVEILFLIIRMFHLEMILCQFLIQPYHVTVTVWLGLGNKPHTNLY